MRVCIEDGCWQPTADTRCPEHNRAWRRRTKDPVYANQAHRGVVRDERCACCGATEDLCRDHLTTHGRTLVNECGEWWAVVPGTGARVPADPPTYQTLCRSCNGSKAGRVMADQRCPQHGGTVLDPGRGVGHG